MEKGGENSLLNGTSISNENRKKDAAKEHCRRGKTFALSGGFLGLGMVGSILGPTLIDFVCSLHVNLGMMVWVFTSRSLGYLTGSLLSGLIADRFNMSLVLGVCYMIIGIGYVALPWLGNFVALLCVVVVLGLCMGSVDTASNVLLLRLWKNQNGPYMQLIHFLFGFGSFVAPLLLTPFKPIIARASNGTADDGFYDSNFTSIDNVTSNSTADPLCESVIHPAGTINPVRFAFSAIGVSIAIMSLTFFAFTCSDHRAAGVRKSNAKDHKKAIAALSSRDRNFRLLLLVLLFIFYILYTGMETAYGGLIASYAATSKALKFDQPTAAFLTSVFWGVFAVGRLLGIPFSHFARSEVIIGVSLSVGTTSAIVLATLSEMHPNVVWIATGTLGLGMAAIFPAGFTWAGSKIHLEGISASLLVIGSSLGDMIIPAAVGAMMTRVSPRMLMWSTLTATSLSIVVFVCLLVLASKHKFVLEPVPDDNQGDGEDDPLNEKNKLSIQLNPLGVQA